MNEREIGILIRWFYTNHEQVAKFMNFHKEIMKKFENSTIKNINLNILKNFNKENLYISIVLLALLAFKKKISVPSGITSEELHDIYFNYIIKIQRKAKIESLDE